MTLEEFRKQLELSLKLNTQKLEGEKTLGNDKETAYYLGKVSALKGVIHLSGGLETISQKDIDHILKIIEFYGFEYGLHEEDEKLRDKLEILKEVLE